MNRLKEILAKKLKDLTDEDRQYLEEHKDELTMKQLATYGIKAEDSDDDSADTDQGDDAKEGDADDSEDSDEDKVDVEVDDEVADKIAGSVLQKLVDSEAKKDTPKKKAMADAPHVKARKELENGDHRKFVGKQLIAQMTGNHAELQKLNAIAIEKSDYQNATTAADGGALVPPEDFDSAIRRLEEQYGAARRGGIQTRQVNSDGYTFVKGTNEIVVTETGEATAQNSQKNTYSNTTINLRKFIGTGIVTRELLEDSPEDAVRDLEDRYARAFAKTEDQLVFTDATTGLLNNTGTEAVAVAADTWSDLDLSKFNDARYEVPSPSAEVGNYFMNRKAWGEVLNATVAGAISGPSTVPETNNFVANPTVLDVANERLWGHQVIMTEVLESDLTQDNTTFSVFGSLAREGLLIQKRGIIMEMFNTGVVKDAGGTDFNLLTQDAVAVRGITRMNFTPYHANAFCLLGTGTVS